MELLRVPDVAKRLQLGTTTVYRLCQQGAIPCVRVGASVRIPADALDAWLRAQIQHPAEDRDAQPIPLHRPTR